MHRSLAAPAATLAVALLLLAACTGGSPAASGPGGSAATSPPAASAAPSEAPSAAVTVDSPEAAAALVVRSDPRFAAVGPKDPEMIGQCCFYEVTEVEGGYQVVVEMGWGDCPSGCIERHRWSFAVSPAGEVGLIGESGDPLPAGGVPPGT